MTCRVQDKTIDDVLELLVDGWDVVFNCSGTAILEY